VLDEAHPDPMDASGRGRTSAVASLATALAAAVLNGDQERAKTITRTILEQELAARVVPRFTGDSVMRHPEASKARDERLEPPADRELG
jgi:hypothetical protein